MSEAQTMPLDDGLPTTVPAERVWEASWGYSRAVRIGSRIEVSGTSAMMPSGTVFGVGDAYAQTRYVLDVIRGGIDSALLGLGRSSVGELTSADVVVPNGFLRVLGTGPG